VVHSSASIRLVILGGEGSGVIVAESVAALRAAGNDVALLGFLNDAVAAGAAIGGVPVLGRFDEWSRVPRDAQFLAAFPSARQAQARHERLRALGIPPERWGRVVDPRARVAATSRIGRGSFVAPYAVVEPGAEIAAYSIVRGGAYVSHDVRLGEFGFVGPNATLLGRSRFGTGVHIGANSVCRDGVTVGDYALIGIGSVVVRDVAPYTVVAGNPARLLEHHVAR
jgi:acetyltransferase EpsM